MPLSAPAPREPLHRRELVMNGYQRVDGLIDVEGHLTDTKSHPIRRLDGIVLEPGDALHGMWLRLTVDENLVIVACEAVTESSPYDICRLAPPTFAALAGVRIGPGFTRAVKERVGGAAGCTHLREMLGQMATVAYQTIYSARRRRERSSPEAREEAQRRILGTCVAYAPGSPVIGQRWGEDAAE